MSPSSVQKQHGEHPARKMWLRRAVLAEVGDGAAYVPFIGSGDIPLACYPERTIYGIDLDPARVADARAALAFASVIVGDCDEGWPFPGVDDTSCYATLTPTPIPTARFEPSGSTLARRKLWGCWARMRQMQQHGLNAHFRHPDGRSVHNVLPKDRSRTRATYWVRLIKPWLAALVAPDGYSIIMTKHFERAGMHYWGAVAKR